MSEENRTNKGRLRRKIKVGESAGESKVSPAAQAVPIKQAPQSTQSKSSKASRTKLEMSSNKVEYQDFDSIDAVQAQKSLRNYFMITLILGSALIYLNPLPTALLQILASVVLMFIYIFVGMRFLKTALVRSVFADSVYYLGFLYTFVALVAAMMSLNEETFDIKSIVGQMGPALITTVVGMAVRIYMTQFDAITTEPEAEQLASLGELSAHLESALKTLSETSRTNYQAMRDNQEQSRRDMVQFASALQELDFSRPSEQLVSLGKIIKDLHSTLSTLSDFSKRTVVTVDSVERDFDSLAKKAAYIKGQISEIDDFSIDLKSLQDGVSKAQSDLDGSIEEVKENFSKATTDMNQNINIAAKDLKLSTNLISNNMKRVEEETRTLSDRVKNSVSDIINFLNRR